MPFEFQEQEDCAARRSSLPRVLILPDGRSALVGIVVSMLDHERCVVSFTDSFRTILAADADAPAATAALFARLVRDAIVHEMEGQKWTKRGGT